MHTVSPLYREIYENPRHRKEVMVVISGQMYTEENIVSGRISGGLYDKPSVGNCVSRKLELEIIPLGNIPRSAKIEVFVRLVLDDKKSERLPKGVFFVSRRRQDKATGAIRFECYDAMLRAEQTWIDESYSAVNWPQTQEWAVNDIAKRMGVEPDPRNVYNEAFPVEYAVDQDGDMSMREVLSAIAVADAGNFVITDDGHLRLIGYNDIPPETSLLITEHGDYITFGGDRIIVR